ncbi:MAG: DUF4434 domain-containing protein [Victivallales bacterium]|nr:DUF4434 domain-containing protein [Victivallales bacterium]
MLKNIELKPITGTFVNLLISDTGIINAGLKEWEQDFQMMKVLGMDHLFIIRTECEQNGVCLSAEDPRSTTWPEDDNLLDMVFRLGDKYDMQVYLGGPVGITNLHVGDWRKEIDDNKRYYDRTVPKYQHFKCFKGLYVSLEALPWHFNFLDISRGILEYMRASFPEKKTFMSPIIRGVLGDYSAHYSPDQWVDIYKRYFYDYVAGLLDYCAPQDLIAAPACSYGEIQDNGYAEWFTKMRRLFDSCSIELWCNLESFQRPFPGHGEPSGVFRQSDYRTFYMKLSQASPLVKRIITYEYFSCMSPNTEWGSSRRLLARYMEMLGKDPALIDEIFGR